MVVIRENWFLVLFVYSVIQHLCHCKKNYFVRNVAVNYEKGAEACKAVQTNAQVAVQCSPNNLATMTFDPDWNQKYIWINKDNACRPSQCLALSLDSTETRRVTLVCKPCDNRNMVMCESVKKPIALNKGDKFVGIPQQGNDLECSTQWVQNGPFEFLTVLNRMGFTDATIYCNVIQHGKTGLMSITYARNASQFLHLQQTVPYYWISTPGNRTHSHCLFPNGVLGTGLNSALAESICQRKIMTTVTPPTTTPTTTTTTTTSTTTTTTTPTSTTTPTTTTTSPTTTTTTPTTTTPTTVTTTPTTTTPTTTITTTARTTTTTPTTTTSTTTTTPTTTTTTTTTPTTTTKPTTTTTTTSTTTTTTPTTATIPTTSTNNATTTPPLTTMTTTRTTTLKTTTTTSIITPPTTSTTTTMPTASTIITTTSPTARAVTTRSTSESTAKSTTAFSTSSKIQPTSFIMPTAPTDPAWIRYKFNEYYVNSNNLTYEESQTFCKEQMNATLAFFYLTGLYIRIVRTNALNISSGSYWMSPKRNPNVTSCFNINVTNYNAVLYGLDIDCHVRRGSICARAVRHNSTEDLINDVMNDPDFIKMLEEMTVKKNTTGKSQRRLISIRDHGAEQAGTAVSIALSVFSFAFFMLCDLPRIKHAFKKPDKKRKKKKAKENRRSRLESEA